MTSLKVCYLLWFSIQYATAWIKESNSFFRLRVVDLLIPAAKLATNWVSLRTNSIVWCGPKCSGCALVHGRGTMSRPWECESLTAHLSLHVQLAESSLYVYPYRQLAVNNVSSNSAFEKSFATVVSGNHWLFVPSTFPSVSSYTWNPTPIIFSVHH